MYIVQVFERRTEWAVCYRKEVAIRGNNTNNFVEAAMRILKDKVVERVRARIQSHTTPGFHDHQTQWYVDLSLQSSENIYIHQATTVSWYLFCVFLLVSHSLTPSLAVVLWHHYHALFHIPISAWQHLVVSGKFLHFYGHIPFPMPNLFFLRSLI